MNTLVKKRVAVAAAGLAATAALVMAPLAIAGTTTPRTGHFDVEAEVTCNSGTNTVTGIAADIDWDGGTYNDSTDYINLGGNYDLSATSNEIGVHPDYTGSGCLGTPNVTFTLHAASVTDSVGDPKGGAATATVGVTDRYESLNSFVFNLSPLVVNTHTDFDEIDYTNFGEAFYKWTFKAQSGTPSDTASFTVRAGS